MLEFSEGGLVWQPVPKWVSFLIGLGSIWGTVEQTHRRIGIVSMPCDSAGAGIIALGAMLNRLTLPNADDSNSHFQRLESLGGKLPSTSIRHHRYRGRFELVRDNGRLWAKQTTSSNKLNGPGRTVIFSQHATDWRIDGEPAVEAVTGTKLMCAGLYEALSSGFGLISESNLSRSDSALCLAGRIAGEVPSRSMMSAYHFQQKGQTVDLARLLTIQGWGTDKISRLRFFNTRTGEFDRGSGSATLAVVDGDSAFLRVVDHEDFRETDLVAVINRAVQRDRLESLGQKIVEQGQWYEPDVERAGAVPEVPPGISISLLRRRKA